MAYFINDSWYGWGIRGYPTVSWLYHQSKQDKKPSLKKWWTEGKLSSSPNITPANPAEILPKFTPTEVIPYHSQYIPNLCDNSRWIKWLTTIPESDEGNRFRQQPFSWKQKPRIQNSLTLHPTNTNTGLAKYGLGRHFVPAKSSGSILIGVMVYRYIP